MKDRKGTPSTLVEAIDNGLTDVATDANTALQRHVRDYLAQKFNAAMLKAETESEGHRLLALFKTITNEG